MRKIFFIVLVLLCAFFLSGCTLKKNKNHLSSEAPTTVPQSNKFVEKKITERPFVSLIPSSDGHWITINIKNIGKHIKSVEYELTYIADVEGNLVERGVSTIGSPIEITSNELNKKILLGTASCTTVCKYKYDEGVKEGNFILIFNSDDYKEKYSTSFRLQKGAEGKEGLNTGAGGFNFISNNLSVNSYFITALTFGLPVLLPEGKQAISDSYAIFSSSTIKPGTVSFKTDLQDVYIYGYDGKKWDKLSSEFKEGSIIAPTGNHYLFVLVK